MEPNSVPEPEDIVESQGFQSLSNIEVIWMSMTYRGRRSVIQSQKSKKHLTRLEHELTKAFENPENYYPLWSFHLLH